MIYILALLFSLIVTGAIAQAKTAPQAAPFAASCQPVEGNQPFFGGKAVFNTFYGRPVPLTFFIKGDENKIKNPGLIIDAPKGVDLREAFQSNPAVGDMVYKISKTKITRNNQPYIQYRITGNLGHKITKKYATWSSSRITVALDAPTSFKSGKVYWHLENSGKQLVEHRFILRFHKPLPVISVNQQGQFRIMCWDPVKDLTWHSKALQKSAADLMLASGIRENLSYTRKQPRLIKFDQYLKNRGFNLIYHVAGFSQGPTNITHWEGRAPQKLGLPGAMAANGKRSRRYAAPIPALDNKKFIKLYQASVAETFAGQPKSQYAAVDYEPWQWPTKMGFGPKTLAAFKAQYHLPDNLTSKMILGKYRKQWTMFWVGISNRIFQTMAAAAHAAAPGVKMISYTYFRDYETAPNEQWQQFQSCPKDPRQEAQAMDELMFSTYHYNDKKFVDALRMSKHHIHNTAISIIAAIARRTPLQSWVRKGSDLSPQQIYQKAILAAAMGVKRFGLYPGLYIDGAFYTALGKASRLIWAHENFYYKGHNVRDQFSVSVQNDSNNTSKSTFAYTAQKSGKIILVSLFNFNDKPQQFLLFKKNSNAKKYITVSGNGVKLIKFNK